MVAEQRHPDAGRDPMLRAAELEALVQGLQDLVADRLRKAARLALIAAQVLQHDDELIAAQPGHGVVPTHAVPEDGRHLLEQAIALGMAHGVVDRLEVVEIDEQQGALAAVTRARLERELEPLHQQAAVGQTGQRVEVGEPSDLGLGRLARRDVACRTEQHRLAIHLERKRADLYRQHAAVLAPISRFEGVDLARREQA